MNEPNRDYISDFVLEEIDSVEAHVRKQVHPEPRPAFVAPKLVRVGELTDITASISAIG